MIFLAVGTQLRFDRLAEAVDVWCEERPDIEVFGQLGPVGDLGYRPKYYDWSESVTKVVFEAKLASAEFVVAHAGIGTVLTSLLQQKPVLLMPRRREFGEHRNDHQLATAKRFSETKGVFIAADPSEVGSKMDYLCSTLVETAPLKEFSDGPLVSYLQRLLTEEH